MSTRWIVLGSVASAAFFGCSSTDDDGKGDPGGNTGGILFGDGGNNGVGNLTGVGATGAGGSNGTGSTSGGTIDACGSGTSASCAGNTYAGENLPLDIYIMFDQSCSMSCPSEQTGAGLCCMGGPNQRIDQVRSAVGTFLQDKDSEGIGVGIGFFGFMQSGNTSCSPPDYASPTVRIAPLPGNAQNVLNAVNRVQPTGETPTGAAIRGACTYASQYAKATPTHTTVVLLVTDGFPEAPVTARDPSKHCSPSIPDAVQAATTCQDANLPVYVLGVGHQLTNLNDIAVAGGTKKAYLVEGADVSQAIVNALNEIRANAQIPCSLQIPPAPAGQAINYETVNVAYCSPSKSSSVFPYVGSVDACAKNEEGWYYDQDKTQIVLCEHTCGTVSRPGSALVTSVGCSTVVGIR